MVQFGIDFGSSGTVIACFDPASSLPIDPPVFSPNLVSFDGEGRRTFGAGVIKAGLLHSGATARHLRHYILRNSPRLIGTGGSAVTFAQAGKDYLVSLIRETEALRNTVVEDAVFTVPADAPDHYLDWIASVAAGAGIRAYRTIDEITAACAGYGIPLQDGRPILFIDFGADGLDVLIGNPVREAGRSSCGIRIVGRASGNNGGDAIDGWLADEFLPERGNGMRSGQPVRDSSDLFRQAKERLSFREEATITLPPGRNGAAGGEEVVITRRDLERVLDRHNLYGGIDDTIGKALSAAYVRGFEKSSIACVLMIGGSCLIPSVRDLVRHRFGTVPVRCEIPREAVAKGAACYSLKTAAPQRISRDYALRFYDPSTRSHQYRYIVRSGTEFPTEREITRLLITAAYDGQTYLGIAIYAFSDGGGGAAAGREIELVSDRQGSLRCLEQPQDDSFLSPVWINENDPTLLVATPPARKGEVRFELTFTIDPGGHLRLAARDVRTGEYVFRDRNVAKLA